MSDMERDLADEEEIDAELNGGLDGMAPPDPSTRSSSPGSVDSEEEPVRCAAGRRANAVVGDEEDTSRPDSRHDDDRSSVERSRSAAPAPLTVDQEIAQVWVTMPEDKDGEKKLTRDGAVKIIDLRAPGRIKVDAFDHFWTCELGDNRWSTSDTRFKRMLRRMRGDLREWCEKGETLKTYFLYEPDYYDPALHEKMDKTLKSGMLPFRSGWLLDLRDATQPVYRELEATDYVSFTGTIDRDLPPLAEFTAKWASDQLYDELKEIIGKNFSDATSCEQVMERIAWAILHGKPNDAKWWIELSGPADGGKTMLLTALAKCLPGLVQKENISLFSTAESKKSSGPNEQLCGLQGKRLVYAEEPSHNIELDGGFLKDLCGGVEMSTSKKFGHQIRFDTTFYSALISNNDAALPIKPNDAATRAKRVGWRMMNRFAPEGDASIDDVTVFAAENGLRELIADEYWIPMIRLLYELYHRVLRCGFDKGATEYAIDFPADEVARGIDHWVSLYEVYTPARGEDGIGMKAIYDQLTPKGLGMAENEFYTSSFKALLLQKVKAYRAANGLADQGVVPRLARQARGSEKFFGVRLPS